MFLIFTHSRDANKFLANMRTAVVYQMLPFQTQITIRQIVREQVGEAEEARANLAGAIRMPEGLEDTTRRCRKQQDGRRRCTRVLSHFSSVVVHLLDRTFHMCVVSAALFSAFSKRGIIWNCICALSIHIRSISQGFAQQCINLISGLDSTGLNLERSIKH